VPFELFEGNRKKTGFEGNSNMSRIELLNCYVFMFLFLEKMVVGWCIMGIKERVDDDVILRGERDGTRAGPAGKRRPGQEFQPRVGRRTRQTGRKERKKRKKSKEHLSECYNVT
jgi:hypothetical protein